MKSYYPKKSIVFGVKHFVLIIGLLLVSLCTSAQAPNFTWVRQSIGGNHPDVGEMGGDIAFDNQGNSYVIGQFFGSMTFGNTTLIGGGSGFSNAFIAKYNASGNPQWAKKVGVTANSIAVHVDGNGNANIYITGNFGGSITFGNTTLNSIGSTDIFLAKYDASGNVVWAKQAGGANINEVANSIAVDNSGNSYITGYFLGSTTFGSTTLTGLSTNFNVFITKYDASGTVLWAKAAVGTNNGRGNSIAVDNLGNSYITGEFEGSSITFGSTTLTKNRLVIREVFIAKYDASGNVLWAKQAGGTDYTEANDIAVDGNINGYIYITGRFYGNAIFGSTTLNSSGNYNVFIAKYDASGNVLWAKQGGGAGSDEGNSIAVDGNVNGDIYITGYFQGSSTFGSTNLTSSGNQDAFIAQYDASGNVQWAKKAGGTGEDDGKSIAVDGSGNSYITGYFNGIRLNSNGTRDVFITKYNTSGTGLWSANPVGFTVNVISQDVAVDAAGNSYITGSFHGSATFGNITLTGSGGNNPFIAKYHASGNVIWAKIAGGTIYSIAADNKGNSYLTGSFGPSATFGSITLTSSTSRDVFIVKYDPSGNVLWAKKGGGSQGTGVMMSSIAADNNDNCYITGDFEGNVAFGSIKLSNVGFRDVFIAKYDASGNVLWAKKAGGKKTEISNSIAVDGSGNCYITGSFNEPDTKFGNITLISSGKYDAFIAKYNTSGNLLWVKQAGGTGDDSGNSIAVDGNVNGDIYITGYFSGSALFGSITLTSSNLRDVFIAKFNASGNVLWAKKGGASYISGVNSSIAADISGNSYLTGTFHSSATFGSTTLTSSGGYDVYIAKYDASGNPLWAKQAGGPDDDYGNSVAVDKSGNSYFTGNFQGGATFGSTTLTTLGSDAFIARINKPISPARYAPTSAGSGSLSNVLHIYDVNAYPNPFTDKFKMELSSDASAETAKVTLTSIDGKTVYQKEVKLTNGLVSEELNGLSRLPAGMYILRLQVDEKQTMLKVIKQ